VDGATRGAGSDAGKVGGLSLDREGLSRVGASEAREGSVSVGRCGDRRLAALDQLDPHEHGFVDRLPGTERVSPVRGLLDILLVDSMSRRNILTSRSWKTKEVKVLWSQASGVFGCRGAILSCSS